MDSHSSVRSKLNLWHRGYIDICAVTASQCSHAPTHTRLALSPCVSQLRCSWTSVSACVCIVMTKCHQTCFMCGFILTAQWSWSFIFHHCVVSSRSEQHSCFISIYWTHFCKMWCFYSVFLSPWNSCDRLHCIVTFQVKTGKHVGAGLDLIVVADWTVKWALSAGTEADLNVIGWTVARHIQGRFLFHDNSATQMQCSPPLKSSSSSLSWQLCLFSVVSVCFLYCTVTEPLPALRDLIFALYLYFKRRLILSDIINWQHWLSDEKKNLSDSIVSCRSALQLKLNLPHI